MFSRIRDKLGTAGLIVAIVALVAALGGGAYAASNGLNGKQKKEVVKIAKKYAGKPGKNGKNGAAGATGPAGPAGPAGAAGAKGDKGADGTSVTSTPATIGECPDGGFKYTSASGTVKVCNGAEGPEGSPWTVGGLLPSGETLTGVWGAPNVPLLASLYSISFPIPLAAAPEAVIVKPSEMDSGAGDAAGCPWTGLTGTPEADPGKFCVYLAIDETTANLAAMFTFSPTWEDTGTEFFGGAKTGASEYGASLRSICAGPPSEAKCIAFGAWAVTAA
ncbi:MAG TPA: hypothetical protein VHR18_07765 [Solirubrobacterales bacterium]|jgi:hypothetical protein|nr:hypothetical protein [Solirubrobacterales bacterium]